MFVRKGKKNEQIGRTMPTKVTRKKSGEVEFRIAEV
jgi:hypothetical protein